MSDQPSRCSRQETVLWSAVYGSAVSLAPRALTETQRHRETQETVLRSAWHRGPSRRHRETQETVLRSAWHRGPSRRHRDTERHRRLFCGQPGTAGPHGDTETPGIAISGRHPAVAASSLLRSARLHDCWDSAADSAPVLFSKR